MKRVLRKLLIRALHNPATSHLGLHRFVRTSLLHEQVATALEPGNETIVVLAPHMDDEVLGCGGTMARHAHAGGHVAVVYLTTGRYGTAPPGLSPVDAERKQQELIALRRREALRAGQILGTRGEFFLDADGPRLSHDASTAEQLREILERLKPSVVYLPCFLERHPDHRATGDVLIAATAGTDLSFECRAYEVWTPLFPNRVVRIDATVELKKRALSCYQSQLVHTDFLHIGIALNAYRSSALPGGECRYAEAFHVLPLAAYRQLHASFSRSS